MVNADAVTLQPKSTYTPISRLSLWCDYLLEAGWLAALIVVPLFFNIYSSRVFEPDKLTTLRSIALFMALVWLVKWIEERLNPLRERAITWRTPLALPTLLTVVIYMVSTALSVAPRTSLLGSYQRLQGTYTTLAYVVIFFAMLQSLRRRDQVERLVTLVLLTSLPISIYGLLQRLQLDPLPWGGDTTERVASNMGNSIFVAAYLVMTFYLNLYRIIEGLLAVLRSEQPRWRDVLGVALYIVIALFNALVVLVLAGSRGPQLGFLGGMLFFLLLGVQLVRRRRLRLALTSGSIILGLLGLAFLIFLNVTRPDPAFAWLRSFPLFNRLSTVLTLSEGTNAVRVLIWEGAARLVLPHEPIQQPDGAPDPFNAIRPLVGYGPESMYVAYNRFYPPRLAWFEARNASPDRSHNETWDSLVITGLLGFLVYMFLFGSAFHYSFRWVGLIASRFESWLFIGLWILGAAVGGSAMIALGNLELFGVGVAAGTVFLGLALFLFVSALINARRKDESDVPVPLSLRDQLLLIAIISTIVAHFVEIHTGIAIASTRTHFWALLGVMVAVGANRIGEASLSAASESPATIEEAPAARASEKATTKAMTRRQRRALQQQVVAPVRRSSAAGPRGLPAWFGAAATYGLFVGFVLAVMAFDFTNNADRLNAAGRVFINAMTSVRGQPAYGVLAMFGVTFIFGVALAVLDLRRSEVLRSGAEVSAAAGLIATLALGVWVAFGTFIAGRLVDFTTATQNTIGSILAIADQLGLFPAYLYALIAGVMIASAFLLSRAQPFVPARSASAGGVLTLVLGAVVVPVLVTYSNLQPISADIVYKQASPWDQQGARELAPGTGVQGWDLAIEHYRRAIDLARNEDFYYLWLGRALLEKAKSTLSTATDRRIPDNAPFTAIIDPNSKLWLRPTQDALPSATFSREDLLAATRIILTEARVLNPLNTDHSANLARMWRQSADITVDPELRRQRYENSSREYAIATSLSPNNAQLWNEWASLYLYQLRDLEQAKQRLDRSLALDERYDQTYILLAQWHTEQARTIDRATNENAWKEEMRQALQLLQKGAELAFDPSAIYQEIARIGVEVGDLAAAIEALEKQLQREPDDWNILTNLALLHRDNQNTGRALEYARKALTLAPPDRQASLQALVSQLSATP
ncbi:MAG: hypothetical protein ACK4WM_06485 [Thermoflexales bacterium]